MNETIKLIEYANIAGFPIRKEGSTLIVKNGKRLPTQLKRLIKEYKEDILKVI